MATRRGSCSGPGPDAKCSGSCCGVSGPSTGTRPLPLKSLNHVSVHCRDVEQSLRFYRDLMGFIPVKRPASLDYFDGAWLFNYGLGIHLLKLDEVEDEDAAGKQQPHRINPRSNHVSFQCDDIDLVESVLREHEIPYVRQAVEENGILVHQLFFHDPDCHMIEICNCDVLPVVPLVPQEERAPQQQQLLQQHKADGAEGVKPLHGCWACRAPTAPPVPPLVSALTGCECDEGVTPPLVPPVSRDQVTVQMQKGQQQEDECLKADPADSLPLCTSFDSSSASGTLSDGSPSRRLSAAVDGGFVRRSSMDEQCVGGWGKMSPLGVAGRSSSLEHLKRRVEQLKGPPGCASCLNADACVPQGQSTAAPAAAAAVLGGAGGSHGLTSPLSPAPGHMGTIHPLRRVSSPTEAHEALSQLCEESLLGPSATAWCIAGPPSASPGAAAAAAASGPRSSHPDAPLLPATSVQEPDALMRQAPALLRPLPALEAA